MTDAAAQHQVLLGAITRAGDESPREVLLLLWFLRHVMVVDEFDAYENVVDDPHGPIDGLFVERSWDSTELETLHVFEAKFPSAGSARVDPAWVDQVADAAAALRVEGIASHESRELRNLALREGLDDRLKAGTLLIKPTLVAAAALGSEAEERAVERGVVVYDLDWLARLAAALDGPGLKRVEVVFGCPPTRRFRTGTSEGRLLVCEVAARDIAAWPGIDDRSLFGLNVRGELPQNRVRTELDAALRHPEEHSNFLAYHNGLTVVCQSFEERNGTVRIRDLSVVNGAQSVLAFRRHQDILSPDLHVLVKFVETASAGFATEVARRSNTQTAVNARNLRANDGRQQRLREEFEQRYPAYSYVVKPEATRRPPGININNDDAAQILCALYNERPWVAVKRQELFRAPNYGVIFHPRLTASHVLFAFLTREAVQEHRELFPADYRRSWQLTALMAVYLVGQRLRADPHGLQALESPADAVADTAELRDLLERVVRDVARVLQAYHEQQLAEFGFDDFKVDFKRENTARDLAKRVGRGSARSPI